MITYLALSFELYDLSIIVISTKRPFPPVISTKRPFPPVISTKS